MLPILLDHNASIDFSKAETGATPFDAALGTRHPLTECAHILADRGAEDDKQFVATNSWKLATDNVFADIRDGNDVQLEASLECLQIHLQHRPGYFGGKLKQLDFSTMEHVGPL